MSETKDAKYGLRRMKLEYLVSDDKSESTSKPIWYIVLTHRQRLVRRQDLPFEIMGRIVGPFKSRGSAEYHRKSRIYDYGENSVVFCHSGYYSDIEETKEV